MKTTYRTMLVARVRMSLPQSVGCDSVVLFLNRARSSWEALAWTEFTRVVEENSLFAMTWPAARESGADILWKGV
jgi:hypothetical protein